MVLLAEDIWRGKIFTRGWRAAAGGAAPIVAPATGLEVGVKGLAGPADVGAAAEVASAAQPAWAARPHTERAAILRRAGALFEEYAEEIHGWLAQEAGAIPGMAGFQTHLAAQACYEASSLPSR